MDNKYVNVSIKILIEIKEKIVEIQTILRVLRETYSPKVLDSWSIPSDLPLAGGTDLGLSKGKTATTY